MYKNSNGNCELEICPEVTSQLKDRARKRIMMEIARNLCRFSLIAGIKKEENLNGV